MAPSKHTGKNMLNHNSCVEISRISFLFFKKNFCFLGNSFVCFLFPAVTLTEDPSSFARERARELRRNLFQGEKRGNIFGKSECPVGWSPLFFFFFLGPPPFLWTTDPFKGSCARGVREKSKNFTPKYGKKGEKGESA